MRIPEGWEHSDDRTFWRSFPELQESNGIRVSANVWEEGNPLYIYAGRESIEESKNLDTQVPDCAIL